VKASASQTVSCSAYFTLKMEACVPRKCRLTFKGLHGFATLNPLLNASQCVTVVPIKLVCGNIEHSAILSRAVQLAFVFVFSPCLRIIKKPLLAGCREMILGQMFISTLMADSCP
jgi:hypothetical protein